MSCGPTAYPRDLRLRPENEPPGAVDRHLRDRQAAVSCLHAAAMAGDPATRERLRRRAARLLSPELRPRRRRPC